MNNPVIPTDIADLMQCIGWTRYLKPHMERARDAAKYKALTHADKDQRAASAAVWRSLADIVGDPSLRIQSFIETDGLRTGIIQHPDITTNINNP